MAPHTHRGSASDVKQRTRRITTKRAMAAATGRSLRHAQRYLTDGIRNSPAYHVTEAVAALNRALKLQDHIARSVRKTFTLAQVLAQIRKQFKVTYSASTVKRTKVARTAERRAFRTHKHILDQDDYIEFSQKAYAFADREFCTD